jgi:hypothetical protein
LRRPYKELCLKYKVSQTLLRKVFLAWEGSDPEAFQRLSQGHVAPLDELGKFLQGKN